MRIKYLIINYALPFIFFASLTAFLFGKTLIPSPDKMLIGWDFHLLIFFWIHHLVEAIKSGIIPFWNPYSFSGSPFLSHPYTMSLYPLTIIFYFFPINIAFSVYNYIHIIIAGFSMYLISKRKFGIVPSLISGSIFAFSGFTAARLHSGHYDYISAFVWIPAIFGSFSHFLESGKKKYFIFLILFITLQTFLLLSYVTIVTVVILVIYLFFTVIKQYFRKKDPEIRKKMLLIILSFIISTGIAAISLLPSMEFIKLSVRKDSLPASMINEGAYRLEDFKLFLFPFSQGLPFGGKYSYTGPGPNFFERCYFPGIITIFLSICYFAISIARQIKHRKIDIFFFFSVFSLSFFLLMSMGSNTPFFGLISKSIPMLSNIRIPPRYLIGSVFIFALIASRIVAMIKQQIIKILILIAVVVELVSFDQSFFQLQNIAISSINPDLVTFLQRNISDSRLLPLYPLWSAFQATYPYNAGNLYKIQSISGYNPVMLYDYYRFIDNAVNKSTTSSFTISPINIPLPDPYSSLIDFLSVKYVLTEGQLDTERNGKIKFKEVLTRSSFHLYENLDVLNRFILVPQIKTYLPNIKTGDIAGLFDNFNPSTTVLIEYHKASFPNLQLNCKDSPGTVKTVSFTPNRIELFIDSNCNSFLSTSEVYYPGWIATIDGHETTVYKSNLAFRSIFMPQGQHTVEFIYRPVIYYLGGIISLISLIIFFIFIKK